MSGTNLAAKAGHYLTALLGDKFDQYADPKVQINQALEAAQTSHHELLQQAAVVIGHQRQLEMQLSRALDEVTRLQASAKQALVLADQAKAAGDNAKQTQYEQAATTLATQLVAAEQRVEELKTEHDQAVSAAQEAHLAVDNNSAHLQQQATQARQLREQLAEADMHERAAASLESVSRLAAPSNVPSLDEVRDKIEQRYATAMGRQELAAGDPEVAMADVRAAMVNVDGAARLAQIRASMAGQLTATPAQPAVTAAPAGH